MSAPTSSDSASHGLDGILIINPRNFVERRQSIERQLQPLGLGYEFIHSYDACDIDETLKAKYFTSTSLSPGQQSCALKHVEALRLVADRNWQHALILEDDAILASGFVEGLHGAIQESARFRPPFVLLVGSGGNQYIPRRKRIPGQCLYPADRGRLTEAYIVNSEAARLRVESIERHGISFPIDNQFNQIDREQRIALYWLEPPLVEQGSKNGRFQSVLEAAPPKFVQRMTAAMKKLRRKYLY